jgi:5-methylcytosine-specific restriction endonuclease McrA
MKPCRVCGCELNAENRAGHMNLCNPCNAVKSKAYYKANKEAKAEYMRVYLQRPEVKAARAAREQAREARKKSQTPWMSAAEYTEVEAMYLYNQIMLREWHVDHIKPLSKGGLHHPTNLQLLTKTENLQKHDKFTEQDRERIETTKLAEKREVVLLLQNTEWK